MVPSRRAIGLIIGGLAVLGGAAWVTFRSAGHASPLRLGDAGSVQRPPPDPAKTLSGPAVRPRHTVTPGDAGDDAERQAQEILADSRAAYASCDTYEDRGTYDCVFRGDAGFSQEKTFHTTFAGPGAIRFAYRESPSEFFGGEFTELVASDAGVFTDFHGSEGREVEDSLELAVAGLTGVSDGLVGAVLPLLPQVGLHVRTALDVARPRLSGAEEIEGTLCDRIEGVELRRDGSPGVRVRLWIGHDDGLLRQRTEDDVWNDDDVREAQQAMAMIPLDSSVADLRDRVVEPLSMFAAITFHPKCNEPVLPESLRATDGSL